MISDRVLEVVNATRKMKHDQNLPIYDPGTFGCVQSAVAQLVNDPSYEPALQNLITAAIMFHIEHTDPDTLERVRQRIKEKADHG